MNNTLKSLLLASAAALSAHSSFAADAVVVEAEPVEYVRVCDMYGAGFFYLPGSETCLKIYGDVRVDYSTTKFHNDRLNGISSHDVTVRGRIGFTAQSETEYGTLGTNILISGTRSDSATPHDVFSSGEGLDGDIGISTATINLAGFRTGFDDDGGGAWNRYGGYGYYEARNEGLYSFQTAIFFEYGGSVGDFNYVVGIQDSGQSGSSGSPDAYIGANTVFGGLALQAVVLRDSNGGKTVNGGDGAFAYRIRGDYDLTSVMPGLGIGAWYEADGGKTDYVKGHQWGVTAHVNMTEKLTVFAGYSEYAGQLTAKGLDTSNYVVGARWNVVSDLYIQPEYSATWSDNEALVGDNNGVLNLRIVRSF